MLDEAHESHKGEGDQVTASKMLASLVCVGLFIVIIWRVTGFGPTSWQCWVLSVSANLMLLPGFVGRNNQRDREKTA